jgi:hypothetical protein
MAVPHNMVLLLRDGDASTVVSDSNPSSCLSGLMAATGVTSDSQCSQLPSNLQAGCHWRWQWAGGDVNEWSITYKQVNCPSQLTSISGCTPASI